ncbi:MAG: hypothetical protein N3A62_07770, partial [Thermodesulfovibrionales bacterium]|nr:hypothetical protein [Thermodesulfovibrionales bacterium]
MNLDLKKRIDNIVSTYEKIVKGVDEKAHENTDRAYGGIVRSEKGKLQEYITEEIIKTAWESLGGDINRLNIDSKKHQIRIKQEYVNNLDDPEVRDYINSNIEEYIYELSVDKQVYVDYE